MTANAMAIVSRNNMMLVYYEIIVNNCTNIITYYNSLYPTVVFVFFGAIATASALLFGE